MRVTFLDFFSLEKSSTFVWFLWHFPKSRFFLSKKNSQSSTNLSRRLLNLIRKKAFVILMKSFHSLHFIAVWFLYMFFKMYTLTANNGARCHYKSEFNLSSRLNFIFFERHLSCTFIQFAMFPAPIFSLAFRNFLPEELETTHDVFSKSPTNKTKREILSQICVLSFFKYVRKISPLGSFTLNRYKWYWDHLRQMRENCL